MRKAEVCVAFNKEVKIWARDNVRGGVCLYKNCEGRPYAEKHVSSWLPPFDIAVKADRNGIIKDWLARFAAQHPYKSDTDESMTLDVPTLYTDAQSAVEILRLFHDDKLVPDEAAAVLIGDAKANSEGVPAVPASVVIDTKREALRRGIKDPWLAHPYVEYKKHGCAPAEKPYLKRKRSESPPPKSTAQRDWDFLFTDSLTSKLAEMHMKIQALVESFFAEALSLGRFWNRLGADFCYLDTARSNLELRLFSSSLHLRMRSLIPQ